MTDLYHEQLLTHARKPKNYGILEAATISHHESNPSCGDVVDIYLKLDGERVIQAMFTGRGCAISQAATSILIDVIPGKSVAEIVALTDADMLALLGIHPGPMRLNCALLPLRAVVTALIKLRSEASKRY